MAIAPRVGLASREPSDYLPTPSEQPHFTGQRWVDGRPIWAATLHWVADLFDSPGSGTLQHFITNLAAVVRTEGVLRNAAGNYVPHTSFQPHVSPTHLVMTGAGAPHEGFITIYFVRTTDPIPLRTD